MFQELLNNQYISTIITLVIGLYAALLGPELPEPIKNLFKNTIFRIMILFLVVIRSYNDPAMAIMISVGFVLTLDYLYVNSSKETFECVRRDDKYNVCYNDYDYGTKRDCYKNSSNLEEQRQCFNNEYHKLQECKKNIDEL
jgi:hypothetical protein